MTYKCFSVIPSLICDLWGFSAVWFFATYGVAKNKTTLTPGVPCALNPEGYLQILMAQALFPCSCLLLKY